MRDDTRADYVERLHGVLRHIQLHLDDRLDLDALADRACFSRFHFHRIFSAMVGESLAAHIRRLRLERAAGELRRTDRSVLDVALDAGYNAHEPFTRAFRSHFGLPPAEFRKQTGPLVFPPALCAVHFGADDAATRFVWLQEDTSMIEVKLTDTSARKLLAIEHRGAYHDIGPAFGRLGEYAGPRGLIGPDTAWLGVYYHDPDTTPEAELRSHACMSISRPFTPEPGDGVEVIELPGGRCAVGVHRGPYANLKESYRWLFGQWLPKSGLVPANRPCYEVYINDCCVTPPEDLITHIMIPLEG